MDSRNSSGGIQNPLNVEGVHDCINIISETNVVTCVKDYGSSQPDVGKYPAPPEVPLHIDKPKITPRITKGVLNPSGHNPKSRATQHYSIVEDLCQTSYAMSALEVLHIFPS